MIYRVSNVESFRQWEADDEADTADLLASINGTKEPSEAMVAGTALHKALEEAAPGVDIESLEAMGYTFRFLDPFEIELAPVRELRASKTYMVDGQLITISGQVDQMPGLRIEDHKTTSRFDPERYLAGYQWRFYLDIFGADWFRWNVFEMAPSDEVGVYDVFAMHRLEQYRYPGMEADCQRLVERFARFVRERVECAA